jgi:hypothetical protein
MNAIDSAMRYIRARVPKQIMEAAFISVEQRTFKTTTSLEKEITDKIIKDFVLDDLNQLGQIVDIQLNAIPMETVDFFTRVYHIPETHTEGRPITAAHIMARTITTGQHGMPPTSLYYNGSTSSVLNAVASVVASHSTVPSTVTPDVSVLGPNVIEVRDPGQFTSQMTVRCRMGFHDTLGEIKPPFYSVFGELVLYAVQRYIYLNMSMELDLTRLEYGYDFGVFKERVESYSDASELYDEQLKVMARSLVHNCDKASASLRFHGGRSKA